MTEQLEKSKAGMGLGIAGFVLGILSLIIAFVPCLGMYAVYPGIIAVILSAIALSQASKANASKGLIIAALVISIIGTSVAGYQMYFWSNATSELVDVFEDMENLGDEFENAIKELEEDGNLEAELDALENELNNVFDSVEITIDGDSSKINVSVTTESE